MNLLGHYEEPIVVVLQERVWATAPLLAHSPPHRAVIVGRAEKSSDEPSSAILVCFCGASCLLC